MRKSKNRYFYDMFVFPGDAPGAITLNVVWMEKEFDAYKLSRCICSSSYSRFWDRAKYWSKIVIFYTPLHLTSPLKFPSEYRHLVWCGKSWMAWLPGGEKFRKCVYSFWRNSRTWRTDRQTDTHRVTAIAALCIAFGAVSPQLVTYND